MSMVNRQRQVQRLPKWQWFAVGIGAFICTVFVLVISAPASFADVALDRATSGRLRLADTSGTLWTGKGRLLLADVAAPSSALTVTGVVLPGDFEWKISGTALLIGKLDAQLSGVGINPAIALTGGLATGLSELKISASRLVLPTVDLSRMGSPWNTFKPQAALDVRWDNMTLRQGRFEGKAAIELKDIASALTPVRPLGSYRVDVAGVGTSADVKLLTTQGPLNLSGNGVWTANQGLRLSIEALADDSAKAKLQTLLSLLGKREGDKTIIRIGA